MTVSVVEKDKSLEALWGLVILKLDEPDATIEGTDIEIPLPARQMKQIGTVMHAGSGRTDIYGIFHPTELAPGDRVYFGRHLGIKVWVDGEEFYQIPEKYIFFKILAPDKLDPDLSWREDEPGVQYE